MTDKVFGAIGSALNDYKKTSILVFLLIMGTPVALNIFLLAERTGYFTNVYQIEHAAIKDITMSIKQAVIELKSEITQTKSASEDMAYYMMLTCKHTAAAEKESDECLKPKWMRGATTK